MAAAWMRLATRVLENPFLERSLDWSTGARRLLELDVTPASLAASRVSTEAWVLLVLARTLALAKVRGQAPADELARVPERLLAKSDWSRGTFLRVVSAALRCHDALDGLAGSSASLQVVRADAWSVSFGSSLLDCQRLERVLREHDVLVTGETGTGKEAVAHAVALGTCGGPDGGQAPFMALNIAAIPETLIESELFGHVSGAFTGAGRARTGHIRNVASGCLFLDEVGDLPPTAQSKLLRVMETDRVTPLGAETSYAADVRYVTATHKDLRNMVKAGSFRQDLYERLAGHVIRLPPLRERPEDLAPIGLEFAGRYLGPAAPEWRAVRAFLASDEARLHRWPGNVRELHNCLRNVMLGIAPGVASDAGPTDFEGTSVTGPGAEARTSLPDAILAGSAPFEEVEAWYLGHVLAQSQHNFARAARILGLDRSTVRRKARGAGSARRER